MPRLAKTPTPAPPGFVWIQEASRKTGLSVKTLYNYRYLGRGPQPVPIGRKLAYREAEIDAFAAELQGQMPDPERLHDARPPEPRLSHGRKPARAAA
ncbi:helix-turn-helix transcriptional regulator [Streptomyces mirabilis]|uniref:helix-turn-helix transcriptional regulator n=1 Tax=Streptomyces mirabilis TaxID=68239 RepID=UPI003656E583